MADTAIDVETDPKIIEFELKADHAQRKREERMTKPYVRVKMPPLYKYKGVQVKFISEGPDNGMARIKFTTKIDGGKETRTTRHFPSTIVEALAQSNLAPTREHVPLDFAIGDKLELIQQVGKLIIAGNVRTKKMGFVQICWAYMTRAQVFSTSGRPTGGNFNEDGVWFGEFIEPIVMPSSVTQIPRPAASLKDQDPISAVQYQWAKTEPLVKASEVDGPSLGASNTVKWGNDWCIDGKAVEAGWGNTNMSASAIVW